MKTLKQLFLLGGSDSIFDIVAQEFVPAAGGTDANIVLLLSGENWWWDVVPHFTYPWRKRGVTRYHAIAPDENGDLNMDEVTTKLNGASGIFIGGGHTPTYQRLYATEKPVASSSGASDVSVDSQPARSRSPARAEGTEEEQREHRI